MMMVICAEVLLLLAIIISKSGYHAFEVSIQTFNSLPVIGEDFTLVCTFTPETRNRWLIWSKGNNITVASYSCDTYSACQWVTVSNRSKFGVRADISSGNLTLNKLDRNDSDMYQCRVSSKYGVEFKGSASMQVTPLPRAPPSEITINDERPSRYYYNNADITVTAGEPYNITCVAYGARPPAVLEWRIPDEVIVILHEQSDVVQDNSYVSRKAATITPSRNDQGKLLRCVASHPQLQNNLQHTLHMNVQVLPSSMLLFSSGESEENVQGSTTIYVKEDSSTSITCKSVGSLPAVELSWRLDDNKSLTSNILSLLKYRSDLEQSLFDNESTIKIHSERKHHGKHIWCYASLGVFSDLRAAKLMVYGPPDDVEISTLDNLHDGIETKVNCKAVNGYPAPIIYWYIGSRNVTYDSSLQTSMNVDDRYDAESTLTLIPNRIDHGKPLLCQAVYPTRPSMWPVNNSMVLNVSYEPVVSVSSRRLSSNEVNNGFLLTCTSDANPPAFIFQWFCNGTQFSNDYRNITLSKTIQECGTLSSSEVVILNPMSEDPCDYICVAVSRYASGSAVFKTKFALIPDPPSGFSVDTNQTTHSTLVIAWQPGFDGGLQQTFALEYCPNRTQVENEGCDVVKDLTGTSYTLKGLEPFTSYRMTLWAVNSAGKSSAVETVASTTSLQPDSSDSPVTKKPSDESNLSYITIAIGVIASASFILLISLGLMYLYGMLCCVKRKKDHGKHNQPEGQTVDQGEYAEITQVPPSHASKSTTSDYMAPKPIPRTINDTTTSYYMDLKPISRTDNDTTTSYYMDLKPISPTDNDTTKNYMDMKPISPTDNDEYISPSATRKCSEVVYVNRDTTDESALQNDPDNHDYVSPSSTRKCSGAVNVNID